MLELTDKDINEIFQSINHPFEPLDPLPYVSCIYKIGNACLKSQSLEKVKARLTPSQIHSLWAALMSLENPLFYSIDPNKPSIEACQAWMVEDINLLMHIGPKALMFLGQNNENATRKVLIIFIRNYLNNKEIFSQFNEHSLTQGAAEHTNESSVWPFIKKCPHLPIEWIKILGKNNSKIAKNILLDIKPHPEAKEIEKFFQEHHHWPKPLIENKIINIPSNGLKKDPVEPRFFKNCNSLLDVLALISSGLLYLFRTSLVRTLPIVPYAAAPILTFYGLYRLKSYYNESYSKKATTPNMSL